MRTVIFAPVPALQCDAVARDKYGHEVSAEGRVERRIVANLIAHLGRAGWAPYVNNDGEEHVYTPDAQRAMESVFSIDESRLHFAPAALVAEVQETYDPTFIPAEAKAQRKRARRAADAACHAVLLICGNGMDIVSDWSYSDGDADGFNAAMESFNAEDYADASAECEHLREMKLGGPGLDGYAYRAALYCVACAHAIIDAGPAAVAPPLDTDSDTTPQPVFFGEHEDAQHCDDCGEYLYGGEPE